MNSPEELWRILERVHHVLRDSLHPNLLLDPSLRLNIERVIVELLDGLAALGVFELSAHRSKGFGEAFGVILDDVGEVGLGLYM